MDLAISVGFRNVVRSVSFPIRLKTNADFLTGLVWNQLCGLETWVGLNPSQTNEA
jgi:hypothetical protein